MLQTLALLLLARISYAFVEITSYSTISCFNASQSGGLSFSEQVLQPVIAPSDESVALQCRSCSGPFPVEEDVKWVKHPHWFNVSSSIVLEKSLRFDISEVFTLKIASATVWDSGIYVCSSQSASLGFQLEIFDPQKLERISPVSWLLYREKTSQPYFEGKWSSCDCQENSTESFSERALICMTRVKFCGVLLYQCSSSFLKSADLETYERLKGLQSFVLRKRCFSCISTWMRNPKLLHFNKTQLRVTERSSWSLSCPGARHGDDVDWLKNDKTHLSNALRSRQGHHYEVDFLGNLYVFKAVMEDRGVFKCFVNGKPVLEVDVEIVPFDVTQTKEFREVLESLFYFTGLATFLWLLGVSYYWVTH